MNTKEVKEHYKVFFGIDIPEPHVEFFGSEFIEFCLYIAGKAAQQSKQVEKCPVCAGKGVFAISYQVERSCEACGGTGKRYK